MTGSPPIPSLIPHRGRAIVVDDVVAHEGSMTRVRWVVTDAHALCDPDGAPALLALEVIAQAAAVHAGLRRRDRGEAGERAGYVVSVPRLVLHVARVHRGDVLDAEVTVVGGEDGDLARFDGTVRRGETPVADATIMVLRDREA